MAKKIRKEYEKNSERMVRAIHFGDNVKAYKCLEQMLKERIAKKIDDATKDI